MASLRTVISCCIATAGDGFDDALKLDKQPVAGGLDDAALVLGDLRVDQIAAQRPQTRQRAGLVPFHQTAVSRDIGREDGASRRSTRSAPKVPSLAAARPKPGRRLAYTITLCASAEGGSSELETSRREGENGEASH
jgi:hypothetical protein